MTGAEATAAPSGAPSADWRTDAIAQAASPHLPGLAVQVVADIDSTNSELMRRARAGDTGAVLLVAERQHAGRGRLGRTWHSDGDNPMQGPGGSAALPALTFSLGLPLAPVGWAGLSLAVGVSLAGTLHDAVQLKWPNDLWFDGRKLGGVLIETASTAECRYTVIGIGINIAPPRATGLSTPPAWSQELLPELDAPQLLARVAPALVQAVRLFEQQGFAPFRAGFARRDVLRGRDVVLSDGSLGVARGVDGAGGLLVHTPGGMQVVTSAEVSVRPRTDPTGRS